MLSNHDLEDPKIEHYKNEVMGMGEKELDRFELAKNPLKLVQFYYGALSKAGKELYQDEAVKKLYARKDEFDLFIVNSIVNDVSSLVEVFKVI